MGVLYETAHFVILGAYVYPRAWVKNNSPRKYKWALIETRGKGSPSKIDRRQKNYKRLIRWTYLYYANWTIEGAPLRSRRAMRRNYRIWEEWTDLIRRAEILYPNTFLVKGFPKPTPIDNPLWFWELI